MPRSLVEHLPAEEQRAIFAHELAHHRRLDPLVLWLQGVFIAIWWFHPLAWLLNQSILRLREQCCDDLVISENLSTKETYAAALVKAVEWCSIRTQLLNYAAPQMHPLRDRIASLVNPATRHASKLSLFNWVGVIVLGVFVLPGFGLNFPASATVPQQTAATGNLDLAQSESDPTVREQLSTVGGRVLDVEGRHIQASVWLRTSGDPEAGFRRCETGADGRYEFKAFAPGWVNVAALGVGYGHAGVSFNLQQSRPERNVNLVANRPATLKLIIRNEEGERVSGVRLRSIGGTTTAGNRFGLYPQLMEAQQIEIPESDHAGRLSIPQVILTHRLSM